VRDIEHADVLSHRLMLLYDAGVLHWHQPTRERHDLGPKPHVFGVEWRSFFCGLTHARTLDANRAEVKDQGLADWFRIEPMGSSIHLEAAAHSFTLPQRYELARQT
jgi:hypothetical protein